MDRKTTRVLLIDDDPNLRGVLSDILKVKGFESILVETGAAALAQIEQQDIDVVLIDIKLEDMSGLDVLRAIKVRSPETECIMLTGHASQATAIEAVNQGAYSYFQKPYEVDQLLVTIRRAAEKHAAEHALQASEAHFRSMIENSSDLICILNPDTTLRYVSPSIERIMGYSIEEVIGGTGLQDYIHPDDIPAFIEAFRQRVQTSDFSPVPLQVRVRHKDGTWRTLEGTGSNLLDDPAMEGIIINVRDVTERKQADEEHQALLEIMQGLAVAENLQEFFQLIQRTIAKVIYAENFFVIFHNKNSGLFEEVFTVDQYDAPMPPSKLERSITAYVFRTGEPLLLTQAKFKELAARGEVELVGTKPAIWLGAPLKTPSETIGVIVVQNYENADCYSERDREFLAFVGGQVSLAIERKRVEEALRHSQEETAHANRMLLALSQAAQAAQRARTTEEVYHAIQNQLTQLGYYATGFELSEDGQSLHIAYFNFRADLVRKAEKATGLSLHDFRFRPRADGIYHKIISKGETIFIQDTAQAVADTLPKNQRALVRPMTDLFKFGQSIFSPLKVGEETIGILSITGPDLSAADNPAIAAFANQAAIAIQNAWLYEQAQQEITERTQAEEALDASETELRALFASMHDVVLVINRAGVYLKIAPTNPDLLVKPPGELLGKALRDVFPPEQSETFIRVVQQVLDTKQTTQIEYDLIIGDRTVSFETSISPMTEDSTLWVARDITERKQAEEALRESKERYRQLVERTPNGILIHVDGQIVFANSAGAKILGLAAPEDLVGKRILDFVHPDYQKIVKGRVKQLTGNKKEVPLIEEKLIRLDGTIIDAEVTAISFTHQKRNAVQVVFNDITKRKQAEEALRSSEVRYRMLAENMSDTVWLMDMSLRTTYISPSVTGLRGFTLDDINSLSLDRQMPPDSLQRFLQLFAEFLSPENLAQPDQLVSRTIELEFYKKDGTKFWSENAFTLIRAPQGQPFAILGSGRDISERKNAQAALQNSEKYFRALIENNTDAVVLVDPRGMILYESPAYARMMGRASGQCLGKSGYEYIHTEDRGSIAQTINELVQHPGGIRRTTFRNQHKDGSWRWIEATTTNLLGESTIQGLVINMHDITERKQAEEKIRRHVADLEVLYENGLSINVLLEPRKIAQKMIEILSQKLDWHHATIRLYHPDTKRVEFLALNKPGLKPDETQVEIDRLNKMITHTDKGLSSWVIKHGKTIRSGDVLADKRYLSTFPEIRSGLYVPLMIGERAIGSIAVESREANRFSEEDERLLKTLAAQSAIAFENARLYQEAVSAAKRKAALHQGNLEIVRAGQEIEALCIALHHAAQQVMPAEAFTVSLLTEDGLEVEAPYLFDGGIRYPNTRLPVEAGITGRVIKSKKPLRIKDVQKTTGVKPIMVGEAEPTRSVLSVPLLAQDKIIGVISAQSREPDVYTVEDQIFMETLASEAAVAFENARLFEEIRRRLAELESLSQVSDSLTSAIELQPLLENILTSARKAIPAAEKGTILLTEPDNALRLHAMSGYDDPRLIDLVLPDQKGYVTRVARERIPIKIDDAHAEYEVPKNGTIEEIDAVQSGIAAPLIAKGKTIGVISLDNASRKAAFTEYDLHLLVTFASSAAVAIENTRLFAETQQRLQRLSALHSIDAAIGASVDMHVTLSIVLERVITELKADAAAVLLFNPLTRMLEYAAGRGFRVQVIEGLRLQLGEGLAGQSALQRRAINIADLQQEDAVEQVMEHPVFGSASIPLQYLKGENFVAYHAIPLIAKGQLQGVLETFYRTPLQVDQEWTTFFEMLAGQTAIAIDNGRLFENLQHSNLELTLAYDATIQGWSQALELRDEETEGHTRRVADLTMRLIQAMGVEEVEMEHVRRGALLHDIGKIAVPDSILLKPGPLDEREWNVMRQHPQYAYNLLSPITYLRPALSIPYAHHEKWDGSGYPRGLKGEEIPMVARIFAIVDVYDALISNRPYRLAWTRENALEYIREQSGKHFDPKVVKGFMTMIAGEK